MFANFCSTEHLIIVIMVLVVALLIVASGKGLGELAQFILRKLGLGKTEVVVNIEGGEMAKIPKECEGCGLVVDPSKCVMHQSEHERSLRNEGQIAKIWAEYGKLRDETLAAQAKLKDEMLTGQTKLKDEMVAGFDKVNTSIINSNNTILGALAGDRNGFSKLGRGGGEG